MSKFVPAHYAIVFDEVMKSMEARENFTEFLKYQHNDEPLLFLNSLDQYKVDYNKTKDALLVVVEKKDYECVKKVLLLVSMAKNIITTYLGNGPKGLNLSHAVGNTVSNMWENVTNCLEKINDSDNNHYEYYVMLLLGYLEPHDLFGKVEYQVILDLSYDQFPRYARSATLLQFLARKGQAFTRSIAINVSNGYNVDIRFKPKDFQSQLITEKDIFFAYTLSEDTPDWKQLSYTEKPHSLQSFVSKTSYSIGQYRMKGMKLFKIVMHLPYAVKDVWATYCDMNTRLKLDNTLTNDFKLLKYISPCAAQSSKEVNTHVAYDDRETIHTNEQPPLALQIGELGVKMNISLFTDRDLPHTMTSIYDESTNCYMNIGHTCKIEDNLRQHKENRVDAEILFNYMFFGMGENSTRFIHTVYTDLHIPLNSDLVLGKIWKKRSKQLQESFEELLKINTKGGTIHMDASQINDHFQYFRAVEENSKLNRMWYKEYEAKKRRSLTTMVNH